MKTLKLILSVLMALVITIFSIKNSQIVDIDLWPLPFQFRLTLSLVLIGTFTIGTLTGAFVVWLTHLAHRLLHPPLKEALEKTR